jgi:hypothetical protein
VQQHLWQLERVLEAAQLLCYLTERWAIIVSACVPTRLKRAGIEAAAQAVCTSIIERLIAALPIA